MLVLTALTIIETMRAGSNEPLSGSPLHRPGVLEREYLVRGDLEFIPNRGQIRDANPITKRDVLYVAHGIGMTCYLGATTLRYVQSTRDGDEFKTHRVDVVFVGANRNVRVAERDTTDGELNYYIDGQRYEGLRSVRRLTYYELYPRIDMVVYATGATMKYDFIVHPGGNPNDIVLRYSGMHALSVMHDGTCRVKTDIGTIDELRPYSYQVKKSKREVTSSFVRRGNDVSFRIGTYDKSRDLVIDPQRVWARYFGGDENDDGNCVRSDSSGDIYMTGVTNSGSLIATPGAHSTTLVDYDAFIVKVDGSGARVWATYFGGSGLDEGHAIALAKNGSFFIAGMTWSATALATPGAHQEQIAGGTDAFLSAFTPEGQLRWSTYYGGAMYDAYQHHVSLAVTPDGSVAMAGRTLSDTGIASAGAYDSTFEANRGDDGFLALFSDAGVRQWSTYVGSNGYFDHVHDVIIDSTNKSIVICGHTSTSDGIATQGTHQTVLAGGSVDAFLMTFDFNGMRGWGTYFGGERLDMFTAIAIDSVGNIYASGATQSTTGIATDSGRITTGEFQGDHARMEVIVAKFTSDGQLVWGRYYGGPDDDEATAIALVGSAIVLVGTTKSQSGIATHRAHQSTNDGLQNALVAIYDAEGNRTWSSYYGGKGNTYARSICAGGAGNFYVCGMTASRTGIALGTAEGQKNYGAWDAFLVKYSAEMPPALKRISEVFLCEGGAIAEVNARVLITGQNSPRIHWYLDGTRQAAFDDSSTYTTPVLLVGRHTIWSDAIYKNSSERSDTMYVDVANKPVLDITDDTTLCMYAGLQLHARLKNGIEPYKYIWYPNVFLNTDTVQHPVASIRDTITYRCIAIDANGCSDTDYVHIDVRQPPVAYVSPFGPISLCGDDSVVLMANKGLESYLWNDGSTAETRVVRTAGDYYFTTTSANGCVATSNTVSVGKFVPAIKPTITSAGADLTSTSAAAYQWSVQGSEIQGATSQTLTPLTKGLYTVTILDSNGCPSTSDPFMSGTAPRATFAVGDILPADPNQHIEIPIVMLSSEDLDFAGARRYTGTLRYNGTMMLPMGSSGGMISLPDNAVAGSSDRTVVFEGDRGSLTSGALQWLQFATLLGNDTCTTLELMDVSFPDAIVDITLENNTFCESGICILDGEARLIDSDVRLEMKPIHPNPVNRDMRVEYLLSERGHTMLMLTDMLGRSVRFYVNEVQTQGSHMLVIDVGDFSPGSYYLVLRTPSAQRHQHLVIGTR